MTAIFMVRFLSTLRGGGNLSSNRRAQGPEDAVHGQDLGRPGALAEPQPGAVRSVTEEDPPVLLELRLEGGAALRGDVPAEGGEGAGQVERVGHRGEAQPEVVVEGVAERRVEEPHLLLERPAPED